MILTDKDTLCNRYIRKKIQRYKTKKKKIIDSTKPIAGIKFRIFIHPILNKLLKIKSILCGLTYEFISEDKGNVKDKTVIYAISHIGKYDYEMLCEACNMFGYVFAGDWELMYATVDDYFMRAMGVLWVDTSDRDDRNNSFEWMKKALKQGLPMIIFPEGIWNLTENLPMMKLFPGTVRAAKECNVPIVPIAVEQKGKHFIFNVGKELNVYELEEKEANQLLRDTLATLKWEIWEKFPMENRVNIMPDYYENFLKERFAEYKGFDMELVEGRMYRDKKDRELLEIKNVLGE